MSACGDGNFHYIYLRLREMDVDFIFKIAGIGIIVAVLNQVLQRSGREEQAMLTTLAGLIVVLIMVVTEIGNLFETVKSVFGL
jgi:stage III sporulation protein AC